MRVSSGCSLCATRFTKPPVTKQKLEKLGWHRIRLEVDDVGGDYDICPKHLRSVNCTSRLKVTHESLVAVLASLAVDLHGKDGS